MYGHFCSVSQVSLKDRYHCTTRLLYMLIEHLLLNIIVTFYIPGQL